MLQQSEDPVSVEHALFSIVLQLSANTAKVAIRVDLRLVHTIGQGPNAQ